MPIELKVPNVGESITEVVIGEWLKSEGAAVVRDENLVVIETDKVNVELPAPADGALTKIHKQAGDSATVGEVIGLMEEGAAGAPAPDSEASQAPTSGSTQATTEAPAAAKIDAAAIKVSPAARRLLAQAGLEATDVEARGPGGRLLKEDVQRHIDGLASEAQPPAESPAAKDPARSVDAAPATARSGSAEGARAEEVVPMTTLRRRVAERLVQAQHEAAILTTFNEVDMSQVMALRKAYQDRFVKRYGIKLGFMSFFVKAVIDALKEVPRLNAEIRGHDMVYRNYYDIGVAVGGGKGLVVPVIRNAERLSFAEVEQTLAELATRARENKLTLDELQGGTFTISNGGIYGSLLSTPILNPPQSGILGMHKIEQRPVAVDGEVVIRPMMYVALSYDHRIVDGREAVGFLVRVKESLEDPTRMLLEV